MESIKSRWYHFFTDHSLSTKQTTRLTEYALGLESQSVPVIFEIEHLSKLLGIELSLISRMTGANNLFYRNFTLKKKSGGFRKIQSPYPKLAYVQHWIKTNILNVRPVSQNAFAYIEGRSHLENAKKHIGARELLKIDLVNFFGYITLENVKSIFTDCGYSEKVSHHLAKLCTLSDKLPQGAPTSPSISNIILFKLDQKLQNLSKKNNLTFTRYADDLFFSGNIIPHDFYLLVKKHIEDEGFILNQNKTQFIRGRQRKIITGLVVDETKVRVPKKMRREYRKDSYYMIKNGIENINGNSIPFNPLHIDEVIGKGQYIHFVEPDNIYVEKSLRLLFKYKSDLLNLYP